MTITIKELALKCGVSTATISRALNDDPSVTKETKEKVLAMASQLNYKPNLLARSFVTKKSNIIGLVMPDIYGEFFMEIIHGVDEVCYLNKYYTMVSSSQGKRSTAEAIIDFMSRGIVGGIILMTPAIDDEVRKILRLNHLPTVVISGKRDFDKCDSISIDNYNGAYSLTDYLINIKKIKKIAHISGPSKNNDAIQRQRGYLNALEDNGIPVNKNWIIEGDFTTLGGQSASTKLLKLKERPEVIFAANDMMAIGCYISARQLNLKIPTDFGVAGFDDIFASQFLNPRLTTLHVPIYELGKEAATILIQRMNKTAIDDFKHITVPTELIAGGSV
ncbi:MAG: LacI family DNA-binding transcriptional regulator [Ignavibacteria bacterium]|nr:LacI family DNA-binding transcriptional regulator [Ignavibacteria bacterium]